MKTLLCVMAAGLLVLSASGLVVANGPKVPAEPPKTADQIQSHPVKAVDAPTVGSGHDSIWYGGKFIVWGDTIGNGAAYDPDTDTWTAVSSIGAPAPRTAHTAITAGHLFIVWGGKDLTGNWLNDGAVLDLKTSIWKPIPRESSPSPRSGHLATWTEKGLLIWGGKREGSWSHQSDGGMLSDGGLYDTKLGSWQTISTAGAPPPQYRRNAVCSGDRLIVWNSESTQSVVGAVLDLAANAWTPMDVKGVPSDRYGHVLFSTGSKVVVWGGQAYGPNGAVLGDGAVFDVKANKWTAMSSLNAPTARWGHAVACDGTKVIVWGGKDIWNTLVSDGGTYDPIHDRWESLPTAEVPAARFGHSAHVVGSEVLFWGGADENGNPCGLVALNLRLKKWSAVNQSGAPIAHKGPLIAVADSKLVVLGGQIDGKPTNRGAVFDLKTAMWKTTRTTSGALVPRLNPAMVWSGSKLLVWGGRTSEGPVGTGGQYDPATDSWTKINTIGSPSPREGHLSLWTGDRMIIWGGRNGSTLLASGALYDPTKDHWKPISTKGAPEPCGAVTVVWAGGRLLLIGGEVQAGLPQDVGFMYDPKKDVWTAMSQVGFPADVSRRPTVWTGSRLLVWGSGGSGAREDCASYDPIKNKWTAISKKGEPSARFDHHAFWTGKELLVWGGEDGIGRPPLSDGGAYNPATNTWRPLSAEGAPSPRRDAIVLWTGDRMIVWGGVEGASRTPLRSGATYDPTADKWLAMSEVDAPTPNPFQTSIWAGDRLLVWSRLGTGRGVLLDGKSFNPSLNEWTSVASPEVPIAKQVERSTPAPPEEKREVKEDGEPAREVRPAPPAAIPSPPRSFGDARVVGPLLWTGKSVFAWAGFTEAGLALHGMSYDPKNDTWAVMSNTLAPKPPVGSASRRK